MPGSSGDQKKATTAIEHELYVVLSCHVGAGIKPWVLWENKQFSEPQSHISSPKCAILKYGLSAKFVVAMVTVCQPFVTCPELLLVNNTQPPPPMMTLKTLKLLLFHSREKQAQN